MIRQHPELNFYGTSWGFLTHNLETATAEDFAGDLLTWVKQEELFKLIGEGQDTWAIRNKYIDATPY
jgi:hypothetical protein